jgi:hypothetical protein
MKMGRTTRLAQAHRSGWREVLIYSREGDFVPTSLIEIGSMVAEVGPLDIPQLFYAETLSSGIDVEKVMTNRTALAFKHVPLPLGEPVVAADPMAEEEFWALFRDRGPTVQDNLFHLRKDLSRLRPEALPGFQVRLIGVTREVVAQTSATWAEAGYRVLAGRERLARLMAEQLVNKVGTGNLDFADITDVAEDLLGHEIHVDGYGTSRSGPGATTFENWSQVVKGGLSPNDWRITCWRLIVTLPDGRPQERFYVGYRPLECSMREAARRVSAVALENATQASRNVELFQPAHYELGRENSLYFIRRSGGPSLESYLKENGISPSVRSDLP